MTAVQNTTKNIERYGTHVIMEHCDIMEHKTKVNMCKHNTYSKNNMVKYDGNVFIYLEK